MMTQPPTHNAPLSRIGRGRHPSVVRHEDAVPKLDVLDGSIDHLVIFVSQLEDGRAVDRRVGILVQYEDRNEFFYDPRALEQGLLLSPTMDGSQRYVGDNRRVPPFFRTYFPKVIDEILSLRLSV